MLLHERTKKPFVFPANGFGEKKVPTPFPLGHILWKECVLELF